MEWENKFTSIVKETESNLSRVRDRLEPSNKTKAFLRSSGDCYGGLTGSSLRPVYSPRNIHSDVTRSSTKAGVAWDLGPSPRSPVKTVGITSSTPSSQTSPALINVLFERVEQQAEQLSKLSETVVELERERNAQAEEIKKIKDETMRLSERLREKGDQETKQRLEQLKQDVCSELKFMHSQSKLRQSKGETSNGDSAVGSEIRKIIQDEAGSLQRELEHFKTRLGKVEIELHTTLYDSRDILRKHDRLDRALSSLSENQRSQSRNLNSVVEERQADSYEIRQLKHLIDKVSQQYSQLESELCSSARHSAVTSQNFSARQPESHSLKQFQVTNGRTKSRTKGSKQKTKRTTEDFILSSSDLSADQQSLAELDLSSTSESELVSLAVDRISHSGRTGGENLGNLSSTSLSSLDSDELLGDLDH